MQKFNAHDNVPYEEKQSDEQENQGYADLLDILFSRLRPQDVENFYACYQQWSLRQRLKLLQEQTIMLKLQLFENEHQMHEVVPSPIAQAVLARLQSQGVQDIDLLDRMFERGDAWLDRTMQLLEQCERLNFIEDNNYTRWCEHALEGAYDWVASMHFASDAQNIPQEIEQAKAESRLEVTEEQLLQKLLVEEEHPEKNAFVHTTPKITQPLPSIARTTQPLPPLLEAQAVPLQEHNMPVMEEQSALAETQEHIQQDSIDIEEPLAQQEEPSSVEICKEQEEPSIPISVMQPVQNEQVSSALPVKASAAPHISAVAPSSTHHGFIWRLFHLFAR